MPRYMSALSSEEALQYCMLLNAKSIFVVIEFFVAFWIFDEARFDCVKGTHL